MNATLTPLPRGWRRLPCHQLETLRNHLDATTEEYDAVTHELDLRYQAGFVGRSFA